ncbi:hypothetical protein CEXT_198281 [Caerostris extrusa]|uniref:Uncharacterized protein n=1 Tax=Caerostris extrusa TaxID=172846 RepID=A0AAV4M9A3_CAEEX|nr:hypothetical protein CEXT_198281 [Caerostris extrusa]
MISLPSKTTNIPREGAPQEKRSGETQNRRVALPAAEQKLGRRAQRQSGRISCLRNTPCFPIRLSGSPPASRWSRLNQTHGVFAPIRGPTWGSSIAREKTNLPALLGDN